MRTQKQAFERERERALAITARGKGPSINYLSIKSPKYQMAVYDPDIYEDTKAGI